MMKSMLALAALATSVYAQSVTIAAPAAGTTFRAGQHFTVDIAEAVRRLRSFTYLLSPSSSSESS